jgi:hypothetical protein
MVQLADGRTRVVYSETKDDSPESVGAQLFAVLQVVQHHSGERQEDVLHLRIRLEQTANKLKQFTSAEHHNFLLNSSELKTQVLPFIDFSRVCVEVVRVI